MFKHTIRAILVIACTLALAACEFGGESGDTAVLREQLAQKDAQIAALQAQVAAHGGPAHSRLERVRSRGKLVCAGRVDLPGLGYLDANGRNIGIDPDLCRAVAAAIFGNGEAIEFIPVSAAERGPAIQSGEVDILLRTATWTTTRDAQWGNFTTVTFYDGQGFMTRKDKGITSAKQLGGASVCVTSGTTTELNLADFFRQNKLELEPVVFEDTASVYKAYEQGRCDATTSNKSQASVRSGFHEPDAEDGEDGAVRLQEFGVSRGADEESRIQIRRMPGRTSSARSRVSPIVPHGDVTSGYGDLVKTVLYVLINAEEFGVTQGNVEQMKTPRELHVQIRTRCSGRTAVRPRGTSRFGGGNRCWGRPKASCAAVRATWVSRRRLP